MPGFVPTFKERKSLHERMRMVAEIRREQPDRIPIIIERYNDEASLPAIDKSKYLVPGHISAAELIQIVRRRLMLHPEQAFFLLANEKSVLSCTMTVTELYNQEHDADGFLYLVYASQPAFGQ